MATHPYAPANFMRSESGSNRLTVGADIRLKGEIEACDTLVVEGRIEAALESRLLHIAEHGAFSGSAVVGMLYAATVISPDTAAWVDGATPVK